MAARINSPGANALNETFCCLREDEDLLPKAESAYRVEGAFQRTVHAGCAKIRVFVAP